MSIINFHTKEIAVKVVYYGPGLCGKTTSLQTIYGSLPPERRPQIVSLATEVDRTIFFDFLPVTAYRIRDFRVRLQLYTVPGQVFYNATRKLVLNGVDGIVFVADSQLAMKDSNLESLQNLEENLLELGLEPDQVPTILQFNKRDLQDIYSVEEMDKLYNARHLPVFATCATSGEGLFDAMRAISQMVVNSLLRKGLGKQLGIASTPTAAATPDAKGNGGGGLSESIGAAAAAASRAAEPSGSGPATVGGTLGSSAASAAAASANKPVATAEPTQSASSTTPPVFSTPTTIQPKTPAVQARPPSTPGPTGIWAPDAPTGLTGPIDHALSKGMWVEAVVGIEALVRHLASQHPEGSHAGGDVPSFILMRGVTSVRYRGFVDALTAARGGLPLDRPRAMNALLVALECMW